jgi:hypothetical protein
MADASKYLKGYTEMQRRFTMLARGLKEEMGKALYAEAQIERTESMKRTPVDLGPLRASHTVFPPKGRGMEVYVTIAVGGPSAAYAVIVHEDLDANHTTGQAKFLESTLRESAPNMSARVAKRIDLGKAMGGGA